VIGAHANAKIDFDKNGWLKVFELMAQQGAAPARAARQRRPPGAGRARPADRPGRRRQAKATCPSRHSRAPSPPGDRWALCFPARYRSADDRSSALPAPFGRSTPCRTRRRVPRSFSRHRANPSRPARGMRATLADRLGPIAPSRGLEPARFDGCGLPSPTTQTGPSHEGARSDDTPSHPISSSPHAPTSAGIPSPAGSAKWPSHLRSGRSCSSHPVHGRPGLPGLPLQRNGKRPLLETAGFKDAGRDPG
jgi:hypothetical protein